MGPPFKRPESVLVIVYTRAGEVLLLRRCQPADFWQSVTGSLEWEETAPLQAAYRELREETGLGEGLQVLDCGTVNRFPILPHWQPRYGEARENTEYVFRNEHRRDERDVKDVREEGPHDERRENKKHHGRRKLHREEDAPGEGDLPRIGPYFLRD